MKILVTGAGGYIGSTLVPLLLEAGHEVRALDRFFFGRDKLPEHDRLEAIDWDCRNQDREHYRGVDAVIDLVAISNDPSGEAFKGQTWEINRRARYACARTAKQWGVPRYILPSSCAVYGFQDGIVDETAKPNPLTTYAKANLHAEKDVLRLADEKFCVTVLRQATAYGPSPRMRFDLSLNVMSYEALMRGMVTVGRDGTQWRPFASVRDLARAQMFMLTADPKAINGQIFNAGGENVQLKDLAATIAKETGASIAWEGQPDKRSYRVRFDKLERLGFERSRSVKDGVREVVEAVRNGLDRTPDTITLDWYKRIGAFAVQERRAT
jgi:nucleoside-diphosphate-sugar epimerase